jgi:hypothetical protein
MKRNSHENKTPIVILLRKPVIYFLKIAAKFVR